MKSVLRKPEVLDFNVENNRLANMLSEDKALELMQVGADAMKDHLANDDSPFGVAHAHYENFHSATNPTLFDDLINLSKQEAKEMALKLLLKK